MHFILLQSSIHASQLRNEELIIFDEKQKKKMEKNEEHFSNSFLDKGNCIHNRQLFSIAGKIHRLKSGWFFSTDKT